MTDFKATKHSRSEVEKEYGVVPDIVLDSEGVHLFYPAVPEPMQEVAIAYCKLKAGLWTLENRKFLNKLGDYFEAQVKKNEAIDKKGQDKPGRKPGTKADRQANQQ